ncbi:FkbM family methyltransferase [Anaerovibrio lipolyticus]|uniref:FkbM family methyltransferase n=1 Tax=Anaerovibrio lipolyticus TaxID=82374 RepID=UPI0006879716|nr:FkbM family methyltransferase [Anaerovibrio lipolyticus]
MVFENYIEIFNRLQDEESKHLFTLMIKKSMSDHQMEFTPELAKYCHKPKLDERLVNKIKDCEGIIIYGCGEEGRLSKVALDCCGYSIDCFCDTYKNNIEVDGVEVISVENAIEQYPNHLFIVGSEKYGISMFQKLIINNVPEKQIYIPWNGIVIGSNWEKQYIDVFSAPSDGVLIDGGAYDGATAKIFMNWVGQGNYSKIICYEPEPRQAENIKQKIEKEGLENIEVINAGLWDSIEELNFNVSGAGSSIVSTGQMVIKCTTIDDTIKEKVSFIKMDIEGAELKALHGAEKIIIRDKPKLAICIYHKKSDIYDIGSYIISIWPECKMKIRHYTTYASETVLYVE